VFFIGNLYVFAANGWFQMTEFNGEQATAWWAAVLKLLYFGQGYLYFFIRFTEPALVQVAKQ
jgi:hypothetical protein